VADLLLAQQIKASVGGNGQGPNCRNDHPPGAPAAFISDHMNSTNDAQMLSHVGLCLTGFEPGRPVTLTITVGARSYTTMLTLATEAVEYPTGEISENTLFDGHPVTVHPLTSSSYYQSATWRFLPADAARDQLTAAGAVTINAKQTSGASSRNTQQITRPGGDKRDTSRQ
jgi:hypothetical protein